jgi:aspartyl-tRNA(Asn)/glutamyl-tRNA(Gln) amidotransferase subunit A
MNQDKLCFLRISELAELIESEEVSPVEVAQSFLDRIERLDKRLGSYITVLREEALRSAHEAEKLISRGRYKGHLHGVPIALKDLFYTKGIRTTSGSKIFSNYLPGYDATAVERLNNAGAILLGKLNMSEIAIDPTNENPHYEKCRNPWNTDYIPGGSSGGSGAALAAGLCAGALGTDTGGSIRIPAALCGIVGLKPTYGRVSRFGVTPLSWSLDHVGPMARSTEDVAILLQAIAGPEPRDSTTVDEPVPDYLADINGGVEGVRIGIPKQFFFEDIDEVVEECVRRAVKVFDGLGAEVLEISLPSMLYSRVSTFIIMMCEAASYYEKYMRTNLNDFGEGVRSHLELGSTLPATHYLRAQRIRTLVVKELKQSFKSIDVIATPTTPIAASRIGDEFVKTRRNEIPVTDLPKYTGAFNAAGVPAMSIPCGFTESGLPVGLHLASRWLDEATLLRVAYAYEKKTLWTEQHPKA